MKYCPMCEKWHKGTPAFCPDCGCRTNNTIAPGPSPEKHIQTPDPAPEKPVKNTPVPIQCPGCGTEISNKAPSCPKCGVEFDWEIKPGFPNALIVLALILFLGAITTGLMWKKITSQSRSQAPPKRTNQVSKPRPTREPSIIELNAAVRFMNNQFIITNNDNVDWVNVRMKINSEYRLHEDRIRAGVTYKVGSMQFANKKGERFNPFKLKPTGFFIFCDLPNGKAGNYYGSWK